MEQLDARKELMAESDVRNVCVNYVKDIVHDLENAGVQSSDLSSHPAINVALKTPADCDSDSVFDALKSEADKLANDSKGGVEKKIAYDKALVEQYEKEHYLGAYQKSSKYSPIFFASVSGTLGYQKYNYYTASVLAFNNVTYATYDLKVKGGVVLMPNLAVGIDYHYQKSYSQGGSTGMQKTSCLNGNAATLTCATGYFGPPTPKESDLVDAELRWISHVGGVNFGLNPQVTFDAKSKIYGFEVPLYLFQASSHYMTGGVRWDWASDTKTSVVGVFVSTSFCVFVLDACGASSSTSSGSGGKSGRGAAAGGA